MKIEITYWADKPEGGGTIEWKSRDIAGRGHDVGDSLALTGDEVREILAVIKRRTDARDLARLKAERDDAAERLARLDADILAREGL